MNTEVDVEFDEEGNVVEPQEARHEPEVADHVEGTGG